MPFLPIRALPVLAIGVLCGVAGACAAGGSTVRTATPVQPAAQAPAAAQPAPPTAAALTGGTGPFPVHYLGAVIEVPAGWPVYDLGAEPRRCARLDVHAVYLGHQGPDASCPAHLLGKTEAVQVEPLDGVTRAHLLPAAAARQINGESASIEPGSAASHDIVATYPSLGLVVTASFGTDQPVAQGIVDSVKVAGR